MVRASHANLAFSPPPPLLILSNTMFDKINPHGIFSARTIPQAHGIDDVVAWGPHLRLQLRCQTAGSPLPKVKNHPPSIQQSTRGIQIHGEQVNAGGSANFLL